MKNQLIHNFVTDISKYKSPKYFTYPFVYQKESLSYIASQELQAYLASTPNWFDSFGQSSNFSTDPVGKMFGVLVVEGIDGNLGHLWAISGKLSERDSDPKFVEPVYNVLVGNEFKNAEKQIVEISRNIEELEKQFAKKKYSDISNDLNKTFEKELSILKSQHRKNKTKRKRIRSHIAKNNLHIDSKKRLNCLNEMSKNEKLARVSLKKYWEEQIKSHTVMVLDEKNEILNLKKIRKDISQNLQNQIFSQYLFLNAKGESKSLLDCFKKEANPTPSSGSGDCCAPKLLQYAYSHKLQPISMVEFWWGKSPDSNVRKHKMYYPACKGKCQPILKHMLSGLDVSCNPLIARIDQTPIINYLYEDDDIVVINKGINILSTPGKLVEESIYSILKKRYNDAFEPILVHRLDMSTSGILICAKNRESYKFLQNQFLRKKISKRYVAVLEGIVKEKNGVIDLPLILDWQNRPQQKVCYKEGKKALTKWALISKTKSTSRVYFYPITGRTHQLRVHAAHTLGLNIPILGDNLYGKGDQRLHLHADQITFTHPKTKKTLTIQCDPDF
jgi:tRNA pseudouridine32 synthase/23S rRNA pseudouridine746 synthase